MPVALKGAPIRLSAPSPAFGEEGSNVQSSP